MILSQENICKLTAVAHHSILRVIQEYFAGFIG